MACRTCDDTRRVCEQHGTSWPSDCCAGPGMPCPDCVLTGEHPPIPAGAVTLFVAGQRSHLQPATCPAPRQHLLRPGRMIVGWRPCTCPEAERDGRNGHNTWSCLICSEYGVTSTVYNPPCFLAEKDAADAAAGLGLEPGTLQ